MYNIVEVQEFFGCSVIFFLQLFILYNVCAEYHVANKNLDLQ